MLMAMADFSGVSESSASRFVKIITEAICTMRREYIRMPRGEELITVMRAFYRRARFPCVIGTIDCTHVRIQSPGGDEAENYRNRKGYFSYNVQTVSDDSLKIRDIVARWPGSAHDLTIYNSSVLSMRLEKGDFEDGVLLGDSGYTNTNHMLTPLARVTTPAESAYNESHIRARNTVERSYGVWKKRFPVLRLEIRLALDRVQAVIITTAILHNMCIDLREEMPPDDEEVERQIEQDASRLPNNNWTDEPVAQRDSTRRRELIKNHFQNLINLLE